MVRRGGGRGVLCLMYIIFGAYLLNFALNFIKLPTSTTFLSVNKWIIFIGGVLLIFSGIRTLLIRRYPYY